MVFPENNIDETIRTVLAEDAGLQVVLLHGSQASGKARSGSDVDIAVLYDHKLKYDERVALSIRLEDALKKPIDLIDLHTLDGMILKKVLTKGKVLIGKGSESLERLLIRMIYNQEDMMPYYNRVLEERRDRFVHG